MHTLEIHSPIAQRMRLSAHSYHFKHYHGACDQSLYWSEILVQKPGENILYPVGHGSIHDEIIEMAAGESFEYNIYTNFSDQDQMPHDWSLVAWAEKEPLEIEHKNGLKSGDFFTMERDFAVKAPQNFTASNSTDPFPVDPVDPIDPVDPVNPFDPVEPVSPTF